jgi:hypothetical protein
MHIYGLVRLLSIAWLILILLWTPGTAAASGLANSTLRDLPNTTLRERLQQFPNWPEVSGLRTTGELTYPQWFAGEWLVTSVLTTRVAPLAPEIVSPGFDRSQQDLDRPYRFRVRYGSSTTAKAPGLEVRQQDSLDSIKIDRAFNIEQIANAYLGANVVESVRAFRQPAVVQVTKLRNGTVLKAIVTGYRSESPTPQKFITSEVQQQIFQGQQTTANRVETLTSYQQQNPQNITAEQVTATYLSPQDPDFFRAAGRPITLYRYRLTLQRAKEAAGMID